MKEITIICLMFLFSSCHTYLVQTSITTEDCIEKKSFFPRKSRALTADSIYVKGFVSGLECLTAEDIKNLMKQIPLKYKYKHKHKSLLFFNEIFTQHECIGFFYLNQSKVLSEKKGKIRQISVPCIKLPDKIYANYRKGLKLKDEEYIRAELSRYFDSKSIGEIVNKYKVGKRDYTRIITMDARVE